MSDFYDGFIYGISLVTPYITMGAILFIIVFLIFSCVSKKQRDLNSTVGIMLKSFFIATFGFLGIQLTLLKLYLGATLAALMLVWSFVCYIQPKFYFPTLSEETVEAKTLKQLGLFMLVISVGIIVLIVSLSKGM